VNLSLKFSSSFAARCVDVRFSSSSSSVVKTR